VLWLEVRWWEAKKAPGLIGDVMEVSEATTLADNVKEIACPPAAASLHLPAAPFPASDPLEADEHRTPGRIPHVAVNPVSALSSATRKVIAAYRLCLSREAMRQLRGFLCHSHLRHEKGPPSPAGPRG
jgi:hypothetical protein